MAESRSLVKLCGVAGIAFLALTSGALAGGSLKDEPAPEREFTYSFSATGTSDYVFRGISQTDNDPTIQGAINIGYGIFYAGVWGSGIEWGPGELEIDYYAGIKPTWGPATFDFGVLYYTYPGFNDESTAEADYVELKAAVSGEIYKGLTATGAFYYSPDYGGGTEYVYEGALAYALPKVWIFDPTLSGTLGYSDFELGNDYTYWNAGVTLAVDKIAFDLRYWDTDAPSALCVATCDERFVFSATVTLP